MFLKYAKKNYFKFQAKNPNKRSSLRALAMLSSQMRLLASFLNTVYGDNKNASQTTIKRGTFDGGCYPSSLFRMLHKKGPRA